MKSTLTNFTEFKEIIPLLEKIEIIEEYDE